ncbi:hypothetical protein BDR03DRAFT_111188 [Suillus americanus]|nr:hypothetical protein BDR03DRAFT_111188 [Suillus americanus]
MLHCTSAHSQIQPSGALLDTVDLQVLSEHATVAKDTTCIADKSAACTTPTERFVPGTNAPNYRPVQQELLLLRVDWLGCRVVIVGLIKDESYARSGLNLGGGEPPGTSVMKFQRIRLRMSRPGRTDCANILFVINWIIDDRFGVACRGFCSYMERPTRWSAYDICI